jgi:hypothetical protein
MSAAIRSGSYAAANALLSDGAFFGAGGFLATLAEGIDASAIYGGACFSPRAASQQRPSTQQSKGR